MMNSIKYIFITAAFFSVFGFQGCMRDKVIAEALPGEAEQQILFGVAGTATEQATRGREVTLDVVSNVGLYGYYTANERWEWSADNKPAGLKPNYFCNESLVKAGDAGAYTWSYEGLPRFWPPDVRNKVSFFAYYPYVKTVDTNGNPVDLTGQAVIPYPAAATETGLPVLEYTVPAAITNHIDVMRASNIDMTKYGADEVSGTSDDGLVPMTMEHALTQITFSAQFANPEDEANYTVLVNSVTISGIYDKGTLRLDNGQWSFDAASEKGSLTAQGGNLAGEVIDDGNKLYSLLNPAIGTLMLIPQPLASANLVINVTFRDPNPLKSDVTVPISFSLEDTGVKWEPGKSIDYRMLIKGGFISVHTTIRTWISYGSSTTGGVGM